MDLAVLRGDPSDGLPGVAGIGAKTAAALVLAFGSIDGILDAARSASATRPMTPRLAASLLENEDAIRRARLVTSVVRDLNLPGLVPELPDAPRDPRVLSALAAQWGVQRQVDELLAALRRQTVDE